jgi:tetratricopeptide (TPR) repeat protein
METGKHKNPAQFWQELKQRKVVRVITVYIASAFAILEAVDIIFPRLGFPHWADTLVLIVLAGGLIIAIALSWIFDITPEGIKKTDDLAEILETDDIAQADKKESLIIPDDKALQAEERKLIDRKIERYKKKEKIYSLGSVAVILGAILLFFFSSGSTIPFSKRDWILISDFDNLTDNSVFDKSLYTAFSLSIDQSRFVNVFPKSRMFQTMAMMKIKDKLYIDERTGLQIAEREGINTCIMPSISEVGDKYVITAKIIETVSGNLLTSIILNADDQHDILRTLDKLSARIRRYLGESRYNIALQDKPLAKVTTSSLEALKQLSLGLERHIFSDFNGAKTYYENALRIDTGFTAAKTALGMLLYERYDMEKGRELLNEAIKTVDNLTDKEKYNILAAYAFGVERNIDKAIENTRILTRLYPDEPTFHNNLGWFYQNKEQYMEALTEYKKTIQINPNLPLTYSGILWIYDQYLGKADSMLIWSEKMISDNPQNAWGYFHMGSAWFCKDSLNKARQYFLKARELNPYMSLNLYRLAHTYRIGGFHKEAIRILETIIENNEDEIDVYSDIGINYQATGNDAEAHKYYSKFKRIASDRWLKQYPDIAASYSKIGSVHARLGELDSCRLMLHKAIEADSTAHYESATLLCLMGEKPEAIEEIKKALENGYRNLIWLKMNPDLQLLQDDPRFLNLLDEYFE